MGRTDALVNKAQVTQFGPLNRYVSITALIGKARLGP